MFYLFEYDYASVEYTATDRDTLHDHLINTGQGMAYAVIGSPGEILKKLSLKEMQDYLHQDSDDATAASEACWGLIESRRGEYTTISPKAAAEPTEPTEPTEATEATEATEPVQKRKRLRAKALVGQILEVTSSEITRGIETTITTLVDNDLGMEYEELLDTLEGDFHDRKTMSRYIIRMVNAGILGVCDD